MGAYDSRGPSDDYGDDDFDGRDRDGDPLGLKRRGAKKRLGPYASDSEMVIDYKDTQNLKLYLTERGKIVPRRVSGLSATRQRELTLAIKRARNVALLPYTSKG